MVQDHGYGWFIEGKGSLSGTVPEMVKIPRVVQDQGCGRVIEAKGSLSGTGPETWMDHLRLGFLSGTGPDIWMVH